MDSEYGISLETAKQYAIVFVRNKKIPQTEFFNIIDLISFLKYKSIRFCFGSFNPKKNIELSDFFKKLLVAIDFNKFESEPFVLMETEKQFFSFLPNNADILLSALYYFLLEPEKQKIFLNEFIEHLIFEYRELLHVKNFKDDKNLLEYYHYLSPKNKQQAVDFLKFLYFKQKGQF